MDKWQTQNEFWNSFDIPAYDDQTSFTAKDSPAYPHITYQSFGGHLGDGATVTASLWYKSASWGGIKQKADEIERFLVENAPYTVKMADGYFWFKAPANGNFAQPASSGSDDEQIKRIILTVEAECLTRF